MKRQQFDLDSLMTLQMTYDPLRRVLEYLLERDKTVGDTLVGLEERLDSHNNKLLELQGTVDSTKVSLNSLKDMEKAFSDQLADCILFINKCSKEIKGRNGDSKRTFRRARES